MGKLITMDNLPVPGSSFQYSAVRIEELQACEYTLATIVADQSSSVSLFRDELIATMNEIVRACRKSPRAENLMMRAVGFNNQSDEIHGFKLLNSIDGSEYKNMSPYGATALYDATYDGVAATTAYARSLVQQDFDTNGIVFVVTDGVDNRSKMNPRMIAEAKKKALLNEEIESLLTILIGVNIQEQMVRQELLQFEIEAEFDQFIELNDASAETLARLGGFVSQSISSQSQALGSGGPSQPLALT